MSPESVEPYLVRHLHAVVFLVTAIDSTGLPFPGRLLLVAAGAVARGGVEVATVILVAAGGAMLGDHALYLAGRLGGHRLLAFYCQWTFASGRCTSETRRYFQRWGPLTIVVGRFVAGVRLLATALAGSGAIPYWQFLLFDTIGAVIWTACFVLLGYVFGARWREVVERYGSVPIVVGVTVAGLGLVLLYRAYRRRRHGAATVARGAP
ncbi:MAG: DedA family protein [Candidatus Rokuibacteriota bacterium]